MSARVALLLLVLVLLARLATLGLPPLFDKTEGRYGEIGREMAKSGNFITPTLHGGEPFWGKPPLHFWATALSIRVFGVNEWAARLPSFLSGIGVLIITYASGLTLFRKRKKAFPAVWVLASSLLFYLLAGQVLLDVTFTLTLTAALASYASLVVGDGRRRLPGYLFFLSLGLALLAKGPIGLVLVGAVVVIHALWCRSLKPLFRLPWIGGLPLMLVIASPWYILAERETPGFLRYFFINEHLLRYTKSDYGDLYGHGHVAPYGMIWLLAVGALLPWTPLVIARGWEAIRGRKESILSEVDRYLWVWALAPALFFTFSRSLSFPYILPSLPPLALLIGGHLYAQRYSRGLVGGATLFTLLLLLGGALYGAFDFRTSLQDLLILIVPLLLLLIILAISWRRGKMGGMLPVTVLTLPLAVTALTLFWGDNIGLLKSTRHLARTEITADRENGEELLFFDGLPLSAEFYFRCRAIDLKGNGEALLAEVADEGGEILFVRKSREKYLPIFGEISPMPVMESGKYRIYSIPPGGGSEGK